MKQNTINIKKPPNLQMDSSCAENLYETITRGQWNLHVEPRSPRINHNSPKTGASLIGIPEYTSSILVSAILYAQCY